MMSGDDVLMMPTGPRIEVYTGTARRRRWSAEQKAQIVGDSYSSSVGEAAVHHGVSRSQIFNWRREARGIGPGLKFARIELEGAEGSPERRPAAGLIEIELGGASVRVGPEADRRMVVAIVMALRGGAR